MRRHKVTFNGSDNANWAIQQNGTGLIADGHQTVTRVAQSSGKYRADYKNTAAETINSAKDQVVAIKFIGDKNGAKLTLNLRKSDNTFLINNNGSPKSLTTRNGNKIYYWVISNSDYLAASEDVTTNLIELKIADAETTSDNYDTHTVDWIATFASEDELKANVNWADDGDADADDAPAVKNTTTNTEYETLNAAVDAANDGDVLTLSANTSISSRVNVADKTTKKSITIKSENGSTITSTLSNSLWFNIDQASNGITFEGVTFDGAGKKSTAAILNASNSATIKLTNCTLKNFATTQVQGVVTQKSNGTVTLTDCTFDNCVASADGTLNVSIRITTRFRYRGLIVPLHPQLFTIKPQSL